MGEFEDAFERTQCFGVEKEKVDELYDDAVNVKHHLSKNVTKILDYSKILSVL